VDNEFDHVLLNTFMSHLFTAESFEPEFPLVPGSEINLTLPEDANTREAILAWVCNDIPESIVIVIYMKSSIRQWWI